MLAVLLGLGWWQLDRRAWKLDLIATLEQRMAAAPIVLPGDALPADPAFRRVLLTGRFDHAHEMRLEGRTDGGRAGYHVVTPLLAADGTVYIVDRGWVPHEARGSADAYARPVREVTVTGLLRAPMEAGPFTPPNDAVGNHWFRIVPDEMARAAGVDPVRAAPFWIAAQPDGTEAGGLPRPAAQRIDLPNDHLNYAVTWFGLAVVLVAIYIVYHRRR